MLERVLNRLDLQIHNACKGQVFDGGEIYYELEQWYSDGFEFIESFIDWNDKTEKAA